MKFTNRCETELDYKRLRFFAEMWVGDLVDLRILMRRVCDPESMTGFVSSYIAQERAAQKQIQKWLDLDFVDYIVLNKKRIFYCTRRGLDFVDVPYRVYRPYRLLERPRTKDVVKVPKTNNIYGYLQVNKLRLYLEDKKDFVSTMSERQFLYSHYGELVRQPDFSGVLHDGSSEIYEFESNRGHKSIAQMQAEARSQVLARHRYGWDRGFYFVEDKAISAVKQAVYGFEFFQVLPYSDVTQWLNLQLGKNSKEDSVNI